MVYNKIYKFMIYPARKVTGMCNLGGVLRKQVCHEKQVLPWKTGLHCKRDVRLVKTGFTLVNRGFALQKFYTLPSLKQVL
jgi:hypothetical protein